jgi:hypothetical protein
LILPPPPPQGAGKYDRKGIWGKNMKKVKRKEEKDKKEEKRKKENHFINNTIFSLTSIGVTNLIMSVGEYKKEELKIQ